MEEKKLSNKQINELKKQLNKLGYNYEMLSNANIKHLANAYLFFLEEIKKFDDDFSKAIKHNYSIVSFCKRYGITRAALYKNQNGASRHESVINYIISKQNQFESYKKTKIKKYIRENNFDVKLMNQLLQHELLYMETYNQLQEAQEKIATLEQQLNDKNNKDKSLKLR